ncbi:tape measure protein [Enterocloster bolteae]|uniref:tape measure protein n=1 Tax=Enterocloster bolteae TaxID=208479 RepID=UPI0022E7406C|nr:tape measure protein [Enterocloster bolteae]
MATIRTAIELQDNFTSVLYQVINSVNLGLSAMEDLHQTMNSPVDTASIEAARDSINQATIAVQQLDAAMQGIETPETQTPTAPQSSAPVVLPVQPDVPDPLVDQPEPVRVPVQWQSDNLEVFTGSGVERFEQEVQSANNMLNTLNQTQSRIAETAAQTDLFPANAVADMNNMQSRLQAIQQRIQTIESNPLNMGTDTANAELEQLRGQLDQAVQEQQNLNRAVDNMDVQAANEAYLRLSQTVGNTERYIRDNVDEQGRFNREIEEGTNEANELMQTIKGAVAAYATIQTLSAALNLSDQLTSTTARLNLMNDGLQTTQDLQNMIYLSAERARGSYQATADAVSKLGLMAGDAFSSSEEIIAFMEQVNKQFTIAGTEAAGIDAAMLQLTQAMGSGVLRGEEYNSILEQAPNIIQAIADYMEVPKGQLKDMAAEGLITADIVKAAMFAAADDTNAKFEQMPKTFSQIWTSFQNTALMAFQPVLQRLNDVANSEAFQTFINGAIEALSMVAGIAVEIFDLITSVGTVLADNWSWLSPIIYGVIGALAVYYGWLGLVKMAELLGAAATGALTLAKMLAVPVYAAMTGATMAETAAQWGLNSAMYACPIVWIIILIIALIALFYAAVAAVNKFAGTSVSATGIIAGAFAVLGAHIINTFIVPVQNMIATFVNFLGNVFNDPIAAIKVAFYDMCLTVIGYIRNLASAIETLLNKIPGVTVDITSGLDSFYAGLEQAQQAVKDESGWVEYVQKMDYIDYADAASAGYSFGEGIDESIANFDPSSLFDTNVPGAGDYADLSNYGSDLGGLGGIGSGVDDIAGNTGAIADSMDITEEDLKYLRDIAEQEAVNRFTTAEITIEQTNHNTVSGKMDLDGVVDGLTGAVNEAADIIAEGVHE